MNRPRVISLGAKVVIYTDGGCEPNPGLGGWGAVLLYNTTKGLRKREISGRQKKTTNNRMELQAVIGAIETLIYPCEILIISDSQYVVQGTGNWNNGKPVNPTGWMVNWKKRGWQRKEGKLINNDLWRKLYNLVIKQKSVRMKWVKGHAGNKYNERCDQLAYEQRLKFS